MRKYLLFGAMPVAVFLFISLTGQTILRQDRGLRPHLPEQTYHYQTTLPQNILFGLNGGYNPPDNHLTDEGATLGRVLFYDKRLSENHTISCASCHLPKAGFSDPARFSKGFEGGKTHRNSMGLVNLRFHPAAKFFWDQRTDSMRTQIQAAITSSLEMGMTIEGLETRIADTDFYPPLFENAFGTPEVNGERIAAAIDQFVRSIVSFQAPIDKYPFSFWKQENNIQGMSPIQNAGRVLFYSDRTNCSQCHQNRMFAGPFPRNIGLEMEEGDPGLAGVTGRTSDIGKFKIPSLRNVALTAPYMHDGRFKTLEEVIDHYSEGIQAHPNLAVELKEQGRPKKMHLNASEKFALLSFLEMLTDTVYWVDERFSDPFAYSPLKESEHAQGPPHQELRDLKHEIALFPNPFTDELTVFHLGYLGYPYDIKLLNQKGQVIYTELNANRPPVTLRNLGNLPAGIYTVIIEEKERRFTQNVIKH